MATLGKPVYHEKDRSYSIRIRVFSHIDQAGKNVMVSKTYRSKPNISEKTAQKEAQKAAILFEEQIKSGLAPLDQNITFADYAGLFMAQHQKETRTMERYQELLGRILPALGHFKLAKLQARHIKDFLSQLAQPGNNRRDAYAVSSKLAGILTQKGLNIINAAALCGVSPSTMRNAKLGQHIQVATAERIAAALQRKLEPLFQIHPSQRGLSPKTIREHYNLIRLILGQAKQEGILPVNVAAERMAPPTSPKKEAKFLTGEETQQLLAAVDKETDFRKRAAIYLLVTTGIRRGELVALTWQDVDFINGTIQINKSIITTSSKGTLQKSPKTETGKRKIALPKITLLLLKEYKSYWAAEKLKRGSAWTSPTDYLFFRMDGAVIHPDTINTWLKKLIAENNLPYFTPHSLRHTFATLSLSQGVDVRTLQARTGHSSSNVLLNTYTHYLEEQNQKAADKMNQFLEASIAAGRS